MPGRSKHNGKHSAKLHGTANKGRAAQTHEEGEGMQLPPTSDRVAMVTGDDINERIRRQTHRSVMYYAQHPDEIESRLAELDREWDIERTLEVNMSTVALTGLVLAATVNRKWLLLPATVLGFFMQHALQGWCPPLPVLRRLGVRTSKEIAAERNALKIIRGDYASAKRKGGGPDTGRIFDEAWG